MVYLIESVKGRQLMRHPKSDEKFYISSEDKKSIYELILPNAINYLDGQSVSDRVIRSILEYTKDPDLIESLL